LPFEEGRPVIVKVSEDGRYVDRTDLHISQPGPGEQVAQRFGAAQRKTAPLVLIARCRIECHCRIPEVPHHLHLTGIVPDIGRHHTGERPDRAAHLGDRLCWIGDEVQDQTGYGNIEIGIVNGKSPSVTDAKPGPWVNRVLARMRNEAFGRVDTHQRCRCAPVQNGLGQGSRPAAHIKPAQTGRCPEPFGKFTRSQAAPPSDIRLISVTGRPDLPGLIRHAAPLGMRWTDATGSLPHPFQPGSSIPDNKEANTAL
jgi:hypothetical protein